MEDNFDISALKKKKRVNSKPKGSAFERDITKKLNARFNTKEFSRTPGSGAFATTHVNLPEHLKIHGDLITPINFKYCVECKKGYNNINLYSCFNYSSKLWDFLEQSEKDSNISGRCAMVILKQDRKATLAITKNHAPNTKLHLKLIDELGQEWCVYLFDELLKDEDSFWLS